MSEDKTPFEGWAVLELMGHRRLGGYVREVTLAGAGVLRIDMPADKARQPMTQFYPVSSMYCLTPCTEAAARAADKASRPEPVSQWEMARALPASVSVAEDDYPGPLDGGDCLEDDEDT